jgi:hypothetical protein
VLGGVIVCFTHPKFAPSQALLTSLTQELELWLSKEITGGREQAIAITWPFRMVIKLLPFVGNPKRLAAEAKRLCVTEAPFSATGKD